MKKLIKWQVTPRGDSVYIHQSIEGDSSTQTPYNETEANELVSKGEAEILTYKGSYLETLKLASKEEAIQLP